MKHVPAFLFVTVFIIATLFTASARTKRKAPKYEVSGTILIRHAYCGGARPNEEQMNPKPYAVKGTTLYIRYANASDPTVVIDSVVTDSLGNFKTMLTPGKYCLVEKWKREKFVAPADTKYEKWDTACYRTIYNTWDYTLEVKGRTKDVNIVLHRSCAWTRPCCAYSGPKPPAAPPVNRSGNQPGHQE